MIAVFALHHIAQKITSIDGDVLPLDWMPFVCSSAELSHDNIDISGFCHHIAHVADLPSDCSEWIAQCDKRCHKTICNASAPNAGSDGDAHALSDKAICSTEATNAGSDGDAHALSDNSICSTEATNRDDIDAEFHSHISGDSSIKCKNDRTPSNAIHIYRPQSLASWWRLLDAPNHPFIEALESWNRSPFARKFLTRRFEIDLTTPRVMGIWNVTPDSFSSFCEEGDAASLAHGEKILAQGAEILDIGAESTRPRGTAIDDDEEQMRLRAPLSWAAGRQVPISLDTRHIATMKWAIDGDFIDIVNDVALSNRVTTQRDGAVFDIIRDSRCGYIAMAYEPHDAPELDFATCIRRITHQLADRLAMAWAARCDMRQIVVDPGIGFGKGLSNDLRLITESMKFLSILGRPVLIAHSRKRCIARATGLPIESLDTATAIASGLSFALGAAIVRVHAPQLSRQALMMSQVRWSRHD